MQIFAELTNIFQQALIQLQGVTGNLGLSILLFTFLIARVVGAAVSLPSLKSQKKIREAPARGEKAKRKT